MNTFTTLPFAFCWSAQELADAMPQRLSEVYAFAPETPTQTHRGRAMRDRSAYATTAALRLFHIG